MNKQVFAFEEGDGKNKTLLGGKCANLCEMTQIDLNVSPGFVITTESCLDYLDSAVGVVTWHCNPESCLIYRVFAQLLSEVMHLLYEFSVLNIENNPE